MFLKFLHLHITGFLLLLCSVVFPQAKISCFILGEDSIAIEGVTASNLQTGATALSDSQGMLVLPVQSGTPQVITFVGISYNPETRTVTVGEGTKAITVVMTFKNSSRLKDVVVTGTRMDNGEFLAPHTFSSIPGGEMFEKGIKTQLGVSSSNEMSSGYSVRGGNFDENLVYVNDIEVYRPFLVRSGQQEGLSFTNPNMVQNVLFSAGGFDAKYGDKLSSVLDITYRKPVKFGGTASASLLGGNLQVEGITKNRLLAWNIGARYKTNTYLLSSLDTKGEYRPSAVDLQAFLTMDPNPKLRIEFLGNVAYNKYLVIPANRTTDFGTVKDALRLTVYFDGSEVMQYSTYMAGLSTTFKPNRRTRLKFITSAYRADEQEIYTVQGQYWIDQLEADLGKPNFGQVAFNRGVGTFLNNGRNYLTAEVLNLEHKGQRNFTDKQELMWGARVQYEHINDRLNEWRLTDSAGFVVPWSPDDIQLTDVYKTRVNLESMRTQGYLQYNLSSTLRDTSDLRISFGVRANHWTVNQQVVVSPRMNVAWKPHWKRNWVFRASAGFYYQPPFYRELRNINGTVNLNLQAQQAIHYVLQSDYVFKMWNRPFKLVMAGYYKELTSLVPYEIDNVRIRYFANNNSKGYATGLDMRINGEFVKGVESWATIGVLRTYEYSKDNIHYDYFNKDKERIVRGYTFDQVKTDSVKVDPGYIPRATDQLISFGVFFQDHLPSFPAIKFNLNMQFGSGLPFGPPTHIRWQQVLRMPAYRRVDAGLAYNILKEKRKFRSRNAFNKLKELWVYLEVYNLLQVQNTVSYTWIQDVTGNRYAVPNYLTDRQFNLRVQIRF